MLIIASYGEDSAPNAMNAAWGGVADSSRIAMYLSGGHKTVKNILKRGAFTVSMGDAEHAAACDYVGIESGNSVPDKVARAGFHVTKSEHVDAPVIDELPLALECKLVLKVPQKTTLCVFWVMLMKPPQPAMRSLNLLTLTSPLALHSAMPRKAISRPPPS